MSEEMIERHHGDEMIRLTLMDGQGQRPCRSPEAEPLAPPLPP